MALKRVLVTGGSGFLGINLIRYLMARGIETVNVDFAPFGLSGKGPGDFAPGGYPP